MPDKVTIDVIGDKETIAALRRINRKYTNRTIERSLKPAASIASRAAKKLVPKETGLLKKSIGSKKKKWAKDNFSYLVGARASTTGTDSEGRKRWPIKYAHLVDKGFTHRSGKFVPGKHFTKQAFEGNEERMASKIWQGLKKNIAKFLEESKK